MNHEISRASDTQKIVNIIQELQEACDNLINLYALIKKEAEKEL